MNHLDSLALDALRAGESGPEERAHVAACAECRAGLEQLSGLARHLRTEAPPVEIPSGFDRDVLNRAKQELRRRPLSRRLWLGAAAAVVVIGLVGLLATPRRRVDIVDAYQLALRMGKTSDVDAIAREAVSLQGGRR